MQHLGTALYAACVDFMIRAANMLGVTYRDTNAGMFFVLWPAVTVILAAVVVWQRVAIGRLSRALNRSRSTSTDDATRRARNQARASA